MLYAVTMKTYSPEIRLKAIEAVTENKLSQKKALEVFGISRDTLTRWLREFRKNGKYTPSTSTGRPRKLSEEQIKDLEKLVMNKPDITLNEILDKTKYEVCKSTIDNYLHELDFNYKKNSKSKRAR